MYSCWSRSSQGEEKGSLCPGYIWGSCHFPVGKKFPMLSSSIAAAASCQRKLKLDNSSCRFSFATSVQKNCQATKKNSICFLSSLLFRPWLKSFLITFSFSPSYSHPLKFTKTEIIFHSFLYFMCAIMLVIRTFLVFFIIIMKVYNWILRAVEMIW